MEHYAVSSVRQGAYTQFVDATLREGNGPNFRIYQSDRWFHPSRAESRVEMVARNLSLHECYEAIRGYLRREVMVGS